MSGPPRVSVIMAAYNAANFLREAVDSVLAQTLASWELVVVDDASTDATPAILASYHDPRIHVVRNPTNIGQAASLNRGLNLAHGEYVARQDADDVSEPRRLELQAHFLDRHPRIALVGTQYTCIDEHGIPRLAAPLPLDDAELRWALLFYSPFVHSAVMFRRQEVLTQVGGYDESLRYSMDYEYWTRIADRFSIANLPDRLVRYREHPDSMTAAGDERTQEGRRFRERSLARLLCWEPTLPDANRVRYSRMLALVLGGEIDGAPADMCAAAADTLRAHRLVLRGRLPFHRYYAHRNALRSDLAKRVFLRSCRGAPADPRGSARLGLQAFRLHPLGWARGLPAGVMSLLRTRRTPR